MFSQLNRTNWRPALVLMLSQVQPLRISVGTSGRRHLTRETWHAEGDSRGSGPLKRPGGRSIELLHGPGNIRALAHGNNVLYPTRHALCVSVEWERIPWAPVPKGCRGLSLARGPMGFVQHVTM